MANLTDDNVVDYFDTPPLTVGTVPGEDWPVFIGDPIAKMVFLGTLAQVRLALAPLDLFVPTAPTASTPGREGQKAYVSHDSVVDLWQYELGAWVKKLTNFVLGTPAAPAGPVPVVALGAIAPGKVGTQLTLTATASEVGGTIAKVEFFDGATKIGEAASTPYATSYVPTAAGTHYFTAKATDTNGRSAVSPAQAVVVSASPVVSNQLPSVSLSLNPSAITLGETVTLSAVASDSDGTIVKVEFFDGATSIGVATSTPYVLTYTPAAAGNPLLSAKATDNAGGSATATRPLEVSPAATTPTTPTAPDAPTDLVATPTTGSATPSITITGKAPANGGSAAITDYNVYRDGGLAAIGSFPATGSANLSYTDTQVVNGAAHTYRFTALSSAGESVKSAPSNAATPTAPVATVPTFSQELQPGNSRFTATWGTPPGGTAVLNYNDPIQPSATSPGSSTMYVYYPTMSTLLGQLDFDPADVNHPCGVTLNGTLYYHNSASGTAQILSFTNGDVLLS